MDNGNKRWNLATIASWAALSAAISATFGSVSHSLGRRDGIKETVGDVRPWAAGHYEKVEPDNPYFLHRSEGKE